MMAVHDQVAVVLRRLNEVNSHLPAYKKGAIFYLLEIQDKTRLSDLLNVAQNKYGCVTKEDLLGFFVMVMKFSCCSSGGAWEKALVKDDDQDPSLHNADEFDLLRKYIKPDDDGAFRMRAILVSLDNKLNDKGHCKKFHGFICLQLWLSPDEYRTNFQLYKYLEDCEVIGPNKLEFIRSTLSTDLELRYALNHFDRVITSISPSQRPLCHSRSVEETDQPPAYTEKVFPSAMPSSVPSTDTSSSATEGSSYCHHSFTQQQPPVNESPTLSYPTDSTSTKTELSNAENSFFGAI